MNRIDNDAITRAKARWYLNCPINTDFIKADIYNKNGMVYVTSGKIVLAYTENGYGVQGLHALYTTLTGNEISIDTHIRGLLS